jgi:hypothetical protein
MISDGPTNTDYTDLTDYCGHVGSGKAKRYSTQTYAI